MRTSNRLVLGTALLCLLAATTTSCGTTDSTCAERGDCRNPCDDPAYAAKYPDACPDAGVGGTGGTGGTAGEGGSAGNAGDAGDAGDEDVSTGGSGGTGGEAGAGGEDAGDAGDADVSDAAEAEAEAPWCDPMSDPGEDECVVDDAYGVFVSPLGQDGGSCGTKTQPCATLAAGISRAKSAEKRVYTCGDAGPYNENLTIAASLDGLDVWGGFRCADWSYEPAAVRTTVEPSAGTALVVENLSEGLALRDFAFRSADAAEAGASSIAAVVRDSQGVLLANTVIQAGKGAPGTDGTDGASAEVVPSVGAEQKGQDADCTAPVPASLPGGLWATGFTCAAGGATRGGTGGTSQYEQSGLNGQNGSPATNLVSPGLGEGGAGGTDAVKAGQVGENGSAGQPGDNGAAAASQGTLSATGYTTSDGADGTNGRPGQGGGGGGASWSKAMCTGPSGGAGGLGGCGGFAGTKGSGGGASIGLLVWSSAVTLKDCEVHAAEGGKGGNGGSGGAGSVGKQGHIGGAGVDLPMENAGQGGLGGNGGPGGSGSGGSGGPSYAIAVHGDAPSETGTVSKTPGTGGLAGTGGQATGGDKASDGTEGPSAEVVSI